MHGETVKFTVLRKYSCTPLASPSF